uniref:HAT C-terminal dimerisation domain-containing protein n=1 Tax=Sinocyclocheilus grahami TaxID=75366 RepID=A0A672MG13_SINGR
MQKNKKSGRGPTLFYTTATYKEGGFRIHARSERHKQAMVAWKDYETAVKNNRTLLNVLNKEHDKQIKDNREYMKTIAEVLLLTATQNIAQRGHDESAESDNRGNFIAILETIAKHDKTLKKRLHSIPNAKYTSKQISLVLRYYYSGAIHESFLHFESADQVNAAGLTKKIIHMLESHGLEYRDNLVGQSYDGTRCYECGKASCRYISLRHTLDRLPAIKRVLQEVVKEHNGDRSVEAQGLLAELDLKFIVHLLTLCKIFGEARLLSDMLQSSSLDLSKAVDSVQALTQTLLEYRNESFFDGLWTEIIYIAGKCNISEQLNEKRQTQLSLQFSGHCVLSTTGGRRADASKGGFCSSFFYPVIDQMLSELSRRFSNQKCNIMNGIQALNPKCDAFLKEDVLYSLGRMYSSNIEDLGHEIHQFRRILDRKIKQGMQRLSSIVELASFMEPYSEVFFELFKLCKISVAIPISTSSCERSFSTLKLVKTHLRSTMADERVSNLGVLSIESKRANELNLDEFVDLFARDHKNWRIQLL